MIEEWLTKFKKHLSENNLDGIICLFADKFEFWEDGSFEGGIWDKDLLDKLYWRAIIEHQFIENIETKVIISNENQYAVTCNYSYRWGEDSKMAHSTAIFLIRLNSKTNLCTYFYQVDKVRPW